MSLIIYLFITDMLVTVSNMTIININHHHRCLGLNHVWFCEHD